MSAVARASVARLREMFGARARAGVSLAKYTSARIGGPAEVLLEVRSEDELRESVCRLWEEGVPFVVLGAGSNVLVSDLGCRGVVLLNRAKRSELRPFPGAVDRILLWAESGASLGGIARLSASTGWTGLEWGATVPGTVGGAVVGNAGAFGRDVAGSLHLASILHRGKEKNGPGGKPEVGRLSPAELGYGYRTSRLKEEPGWGVVLSAEFLLASCARETALGRIEEMVSRRKRTQPPGASMGSMFKNPAGDYAGRLIEAAGLKGLRVGKAEVSRLHANFFINSGGASAADVSSLMEQVVQSVRDRFGVTLEAEIERLGEWPAGMPGVTHG